MKEIIKKRLDVNFFELIQDFTHPKNTNLVENKKRILEDFEKWKALAKKMYQEQETGMNDTKNQLICTTQTILKDLKKINKNLMIESFTKYKLLILYRISCNINQNQQLHDSGAINYDMSISILSAIWENLDESAKCEVTKKMTKIIYSNIYSIIKIDDISMLTYIFLDMFEFSCDITIFDCLIHMLKYYCQNVNISEDYEQDFQLRIKIFNSMIQQIIDSNTELKSLRNYERSTRIPILDNYYCTIISILDFPALLNTQIQYLKSFSSFLPKSIMVIYDKIISMFCNVSTLNENATERIRLLQFIINEYIKCAYIVINNGFDQLSIYDVFRKIMSTFSCVTTCGIWSYLDKKDKTNEKWIAILKILYDKDFKKNRISQISALITMINGAIYIENVNIDLVTKIFMKSLNFTQLRNQPRLICSIHKMMTIYPSVILELQQALLQESFKAIFANIENFSKNFTLLYLGNVKIEIWNILQAIRWLTEVDEIRYKFGISFLKTIILMDSKCNDYHLKLNHAIAYMLSRIITSKDLSSSRKNDISLLVVTTRINLIEYVEILHINKNENYIERDLDNNFKYIMDLDSMDSSVLKIIFTQSLTDISSELWKICESDRLKENGSITFYKFCILILLHECGNVKEFAKNMKTLNSFLDNLIKSRCIQEVFLCINKCISVFGKLIFDRKGSNNIIQLISDYVKERMLVEIENAIIHSLELKNNKIVFEFWLQLIMDLKNANTESNRLLLNFICRHIIEKNDIFEHFYEQISKSKIKITDNFWYIEWDSSDQNIFLKWDSNEYPYAYIHWLNAITKYEHETNLISKRNTQLLKKMETIPEIYIKRTNLYQRLNLILNKMLFPLNVYLFLSYWVKIQNNKEYMENITNSEIFVQKVTEIETYLRETIRKNFPRAQLFSEDYIEIFTQLLYCLKNKKYDLMEGNLLKNTFEMLESSLTKLTSLCQFDLDNWRVRKASIEMDFQDILDPYIGNSNFLEDISKVDHSDIIKILDLPNIQQASIEADPKTSMIDVLKNLNSLYLNIIASLDSHEKEFNTLSNYMNAICNQSGQEKVQSDNTFNEFSEQEIAKIHKNASKYDQIIRDLTNDKIIDLSYIYIYISSLMQIQRRELPITNELEIQISVCVESIANVMKKRKSNSLKFWKSLSVYILEITCKYSKSVNNNNNNNVILTVYNHLVRQSNLLFKIKTIFDFELVPELYFLLQQHCISFIKNNNSKYVKNTIILQCNEQCNWDNVIKILSESNKYSKIRIYLKNLFIIMKYVNDTNMIDSFRRLLQHSSNLLGHYIKENSDQSRQTECIKLIFSQIFKNSIYFEFVNSIFSEFTSFYFRPNVTDSFHNYMRYENLQQIEPIRKSLILFSIEYFTTLIQDSELQIDKNNLLIVTKYVIEITYYYIRMKDEHEAQEYFKFIKLTFLFVKKLELSERIDKLNFRSRELSDTIIKIMKSFFHMKNYFTDLILILPTIYYENYKFSDFFSEFIHTNFKVDQAFIDLSIKGSLTWEQEIKCAHILSYVQHKNVDYSIPDLEFAILRILTNLVTKSNIKVFSLDDLYKFLLNIMRIISKKPDLNPINEEQMTWICQNLKETFNTRLVYFDTKSLDSGFFKNLIHFIRKGSKMKIPDDKYKDINIGGIISIDSLTIFYSSLIKIIFKLFQEEPYSTTHDLLLQTIILDLDNHSYINSSEISEVISNVEEKIQDNHVVSLFWKKMILEFDDILPDDLSFIYFIQCFFMRCNHFSAYLNFYRFTCITLERYIDKPFITKASWILRILDLCCICMEIYDAKNKLCVDAESNNNKSFETITEYIQSRFGDLSPDIYDTFLNNYNHEFYLTRLFMGIVVKQSDGSMSYLIIKIFQSLTSFMTDQIFRISIVQLWSMYMLINTSIDIICKIPEMNSSVSTEIQKFISSFLKIGCNNCIFQFPTGDDLLFSFEDVKKCHRLIFFSTCLLHSMQKDMVVSEIREEKFIYEYFLDHKLLNELKLENLHENLLSNIKTTKLWSKEEIIAINDTLREEFEKIVI